MKKVTVTLLAASLLATSAGYQAEASKSTIKEPNLKSQTTVKQLKAGTYAVNGVKLDTPYTQAVKTFGVPAEEQEYRSDDYTFAAADYKTFSFTASNENRNAPLSTMKVSDFYFVLKDKSIKLKDLQRTLGKADHSEIYDNDTKDIKDDILSQSYGHLGLSLERPKGVWTVTDITYSSEVTANIDPSNLKEADIKSPKVEDLKAMKSGNYQFFKVKLGMSKAQVASTIGESSADSVERKKGQIKTIASTYGTMSNVTLDYSVPAGNVLKSLSFGYYDDEDLKLADVEKQLGKATSTKNATRYDEDEDGKVKVYETVRTYGKHLKISAEKTGKYYIVTEVTYK